MSETTTTTPETLRAEAAAHEQEAYDSFERCDTDGFLSQWASGLSAQFKRAQADLIERGGTFEFPALFDLDGNLVPAKLLDTRYGTSWAIFATADDAESYNGRIVAWVGAFPKRASTMERKGYREGTVEVAARVDYWSPPGARGMSGAGSVSIRTLRADSGFDRNARIIDTGMTPVAKNRAARLARQAAAEEAANGE